MNLSCQPQSKAFLISRNRALQVRRKDQWWRRIFWVNLRVFCLFSSETEVKVGNEVDVLASLSDSVKNSFNSLWQGAEETDRSVMLEEQRVFIRFSYQNKDGVIPTFRVGMGFLELHSWCFLYKFRTVHLTVGLKCHLRKICWISENRWNLVVVCFFVWEL